MVQRENHGEVAIVGAGASGVFAAIQIKEMDANIPVTLYESGSKCLQKVRISGGGRCNVTHDLYDVQLLVQKYPRGNRELRGPFTAFQPRDMLRWLDDNGVRTKIEKDGRIFPTSDSSQTIIDCFLDRLNQLGIEIKYNYSLSQVSCGKEGGFSLEFKNGYVGRSKYLIMSTGSSRIGHQLVQSLGHRISRIAPSLFTFQIRDERISELSGISFQDVALSLQVGKKKFTERGPVLITHWGMSGPAIIRLSAWAARELQESAYRAILRIKFSPEESEEQVRERIFSYLKQNASKKITNASFSTFPKRYWEQLIQLLSISTDKTGSQLSKKEINRLVQEVVNSEFQVEGKGIFKEEFVTCGGVPLKEVNCKEMSSKIVPNLYFTGELLDVDGVTGGFNFQNAWTSAFLAARSLTSTDSEPET